VLLCALLHNGLQRKTNYSHQQSYCLEMAWLCFEDITRKKYGLLKTKRRDIPFRLLVLILNIVATPILLVAHFFIIYVFPCMQSTIAGCCCRLCFTDSGLLRFCARFLYTDQEFPPTKASLGSVKTNKTVEWKRASEITFINSKNETKKLTKLFENGMDPSDVCQGALGNCWLLSALASLSNKPSTIENAFITREFNPRGKYVLKLWDSPNEKFVRVQVDDFIPVERQSGLPAFTENNGNEMWVMIMEKVFAKFMGSYAATEGGHSLYAMHTITGGLVYKFNMDIKSNEWTKLEMKVHRAEPSGEPDVRFFLAGKNKKLSSDAMYDLVAKYHRCHLLVFLFPAGSLTHYYCLTALVCIMLCYVVLCCVVLCCVVLCCAVLCCGCSEGCVLAAGTRGTDNTIEEGRGKKGGIVPGHAYTVLQVYSPLLTLKSGIRLVKLRNPW
jgi:hypothetical protein